MYTVAALVVVTFRLEAARVGVRTEKPAYRAAVPEAEVLLSVNVLDVIDANAPLALGVPAFTPTVNRKPVVAGEEIVVTPDESSVNVNPANDTDFVTGNATSVPFV